ncbi:MAG TPA: N-formylglutamate amidohydrolase [Sphingomonas sp.]|nr:N-formylglutamate amidohydrolase [Sphingomonas sp.]
MASAAQSFDVLGSLDAPASPVVLSVPHAGRDYPLALRAALRVPVESLTILEDRHVDAVACAARGGETLLIQRPARAWIDLNRAETERDPRLDEGASARGRPIDSAKLRSGLGLVPRRAGRLGDLWRRRLSDAEVTARIRADHRPYHAALAQALAAARRRFGIALLLDVHSMPPPGTAEIVFGDRFGRTAAARFVHRIEAEAEAAGFAHALNTPYSGGHILDRHGDPAHGIHAIQIEWSRALYLDAALDVPGPGLARVAATLGAMIEALADEAAGGARRLAAE